MSEVYQRPSFFLSSIDQISFKQRFLSGEFFVDTEIIPFHTRNVTTVISDIKNDNSKGIYRTFNEEQKERIVAVANHTSFLDFEEGKLSDNCCCQYCYRPFTGKNYGVTIGRTIQLISTPTGQKEIYVYFTDGRHCSDRHAFGAIDMYVKYQSRKAEIKKLFLERYEMEHGGKSFFAPNPSDLLIVNGGSLTPEQWEDKRYIYKEDRTINVPQKINYVRHLNQCLLNSSPSQ